MSIAVESRASLVLPSSSGPLTVAIQHRGHWRETPVDCCFLDAVDAAQDAHQRSGLPVQVRDECGAVLFDLRETAGQWNSTESTPG